MIFNNESEFQKAVNNDLIKLSIPYYHRKSSAGGHRITSNTFTIDGVKMTWVDNIIYLPNGKAAFIELKHGIGKPSPGQYNFIKHFKSLGYDCKVIYTWVDWLILKKRYDIGVKK